MSPFMTTLVAILVLHGSLRADEPDTTASAARLPTLFIIGDSTVKNGSGKGVDGLWGWGDPIADSFDKAKIRRLNTAVVVEGLKGLKDVTLSRSLSDAPKD
jgi:hypothetical protein